MGNICCPTKERDTGDYGAGGASRAPRRQYDKGGPKAFTGAGHTLGGGGVDSTMVDVDPREAAAAAAMERAAAATATPKDRKLAERRQKDELVGKIYANYQQIGADPPIGLAACSVDQLKKHLDHVRSQSSRTANSKPVGHATNV